MRRRASAAAVLLTFLTTTPFVSAQSGPGDHRPGVAGSSIRAAGGRSSLDGSWTNGTATPLERPAEFAERFSLTEAEALDYEKFGMARLLKHLPESEIVTSGDLNDAYLDTSWLKLAGGRRTSLIVDPANGKLPAKVKQEQTSSGEPAKRSYDDPEAFDLDERCLMSTAFGSSNATPPMIPNPFGLNFYQIVQTPTHVIILSELVHDARIIRIGARHLPSSIRLWLGDSVGRWENDTLVVDTTNFSEKMRFGGASERLHVVERFTRTDASTISYRVTVDDPSTWTTPWTADIPFKATNERLFEFACHEANYSLGNSLRGARTEEREALVDSARSR